MNKTAFIVVTLALAATTAACDVPGRGAHAPSVTYEEREGHGTSEHDEAPDPRLQEPAVIAAASLGILTVLSGTTLWLIRLARWLRRRRVRLSSD